MRVISSGESSKRTGFARGAPRGIHASEEIMATDGAPSNFKHLSHAWSAGEKKQSEEGGEWLGL